MNTQKNKDSDNNAPNDVVHNFVVICGGFLVLFLAYTLLSSIFGRIFENTFKETIVMDAVDQGRIKEIYKIAELTNYPKDCRVHEPERGKNNYHINLSWSFRNKNLEGNVFAKNEDLFTKIAIIEYGSDLLRESLTVKRDIEGMDSKKIKEIVREKIKDLYIQCTESTKDYLKKIGK